MGNQLWLPDGGRRLGGRPGKHLGLPVQNGPLRRLCIPDRLPAPGHLRRRGRHARRVVHRPQDRPRRRRRLCEARQEVQVDRPAGHTCGVLSAGVLQRPRRTRHALHVRLHTADTRCGRLRRTERQLLRIHTPRLQRHGLLPRAVHSLQRRYRHGRHTGRHREVLHGGNARAVLHAPVRHHLRCVPAGRGRGLRFHAHPELKAHLHLLRLLKCPKDSGRTDVLLTVAWHGRHNLLRLLPG